MSMLEEALREKIGEACEKRGAVLHSRQLDALIEVFAEALDEVVEANHSPLSGKVYFRTKIER